METVKKTDNYTIIKKRSGRFGILNPKQQWVRGEEKVKILLTEKLIKLTASKKPIKKEDEPKPAEVAQAAAAPTPEAAPAEVAAAKAEKKTE